MLCRLKPFHWRVQWSLGWGNLGSRHFFKLTPNGRHKRYVGAWRNGAPAKSQKWIAHNSMQQGFDGSWWGRKRWVSGEGVAKCSQVSTWLEFCCYAYFFFECMCHACLHWFGSFAAHTWSQGSQVRGVVQKACESGPELDCASKAWVAAEASKEKEKTDGGVDFLQLPWLPICLSSNAWLVCSLEKTLLPYDRHQFGPRLRPTWGSIGRWGSLLIVQIQGLGLGRDFTTNAASQSRSWFFWHGLFLQSPQ